MAQVNPLTREVLVKLVYYGPGLGGKTTSLQHIHRASPVATRGQLVSLATPVDRTLYFDFLPLRTTQVRDHSVRLQLFTVPGQVYFNATRKLVLTGADGVVFVADSQADRLDANLESLENLADNLDEQGRSLAEIPLVFQYNKQDLEGVMGLARMDESLNALGAPSFATCATSGSGVVEALDELVRRVLDDLEVRHVLGPVGKPTVEPRFGRAEGGLDEQIGRASQRVWDSDHLSLDASEGAAEARTARSKAPPIVRGSAKESAPARARPAPPRPPSRPLPSGPPLWIGAEAEPEPKAEPELQSEAFAPGEAPAPGEALAPSEAPAPGEARPSPASSASIETPLAAAPGPPPALEAPTLEAPALEAPAPPRSPPGPTLPIPRADAPPIVGHDTPTALLATLADRPARGPLPSTLSSPIDHSRFELPLAELGEQASAGGASGPSWAPLFADSHDAIVHIESAIAHGRLRDAILRAEVLATFLLQEVAAELRLDTSLSQPALLAPLVGLEGPRWIGFVRLVRRVRAGGPVEVCDALRALGMVIELRLRLDALES